MSNKSSPEINKINITPEDVDVIIRKATTDSSIKVLDYNIVNQSGEALGLSTLYSHLKVNIQRPDKKIQETLDYFVKAFPYSNSAQADLLTQLSMFDREIFFYNIIIPLFTSKYDIKKWSPTCFLAKKDRIVLEDLKSQNYQICDTFFDNYELLKSAIATVARFHSSSILADAHLNRDSERSIPLNERFPEVVKETQFSDAEIPKDWFDNGVIAASNIAKYLGKNPEDVQQKFKRISDIIKPSKNHCNVILHADLWKNNIMFDKAKPLPNSILVDFQTTRYGPIVLDLLQLLHLNSSPAFRAKFEKKLVDHYHCVLAETVRRNDPHVGIPTREKIDLGLQEFRIFGMLLSCLYFPTAMLNPKILTELASDENQFKKVIYGERTDFILENFEKDELYKIRVVGAITELAEIS